MSWWDVATMRISRAVNYLTSSEFGMDAYYFMGGFTESMLDWISPGWVRDHYGIGAGASSNGAWAAGSAAGTVLSTVIGGMVSAVCKPALIVKAAKLLLSAKTAAETVDLIGKVASGTATWGDFMSLTLQSLGIVFGKLNAKCFVAGTQVLVGYDDQGQPITRNIEDLREGDFVLAIDENNPQGGLVLRQVTKVWIKTTFGLLIVNIENDTGETTQLRTTDEHPFFVEGAGWVQAADLKPGDRLLQPDGAFATVTATAFEQHEAGLTVYNLEVEGAHTYFVNDATSGAMVWVHNANGYSTADISVISERAAREALRRRGHTIVGSIQNNSGHGIDLISRKAGNLFFWEVKGSTIGKMKLSDDQAKGAASFVQNRLNRALGWGSLNAEQRKMVRNLQLEIRSGKVNGGVIYIPNVFSGSGSIVKFRKW